MRKLAVMVMSFVAAVMLGGAAVLDGGGLLGNAAAGLCLVSRIIPGDEFAVGVAGGQDLQIHCKRPEAGRRRRRHAGDGCGGSCNACGTHEGTPGDHVSFHNCLAF